ncbi:hypothetical protein BWQ96_08194 [Gracilariopsis chorda]|uniref:NAD(P)-binding domain-containing protein n=1 Tax=Gracilariopsis chorda TaxID=448386 RepID=A0A2V3IJ64_9FLOR|nr:hypothetical protein BWQ96_08194 [Gracilariopsis chorda]|eukprot:PXF42088.1 hypothetical protein BWQ96_08194 [Gracilariopsis chorda]
MKKPAGFISPFLNRRTEFVGDYVFFNCHSPRTKCPRHPVCSTEEPKEPSSRARKRPVRKPSAFERTIDDLTMKRMGKGTIYYGPRSGGVQEQQSDVNEEDDILKPNPVLVTGGTGRTGQWISLGLLNQEFNVRVLTRSFDRAEKLFGPSGSNVDIFEGNISNYSQVLDAVDGCTAIVCASGASWWLPGGFAAVDVTGVRNLVKAAQETGGISRFVLISASEPKSGRGSAKVKAEQIVKESGLPYVILRVANLSDTQGGIQEIVLNPETGAAGISARSISRVDLAQVVCQALVYGRSVSQLNEADPDTEFDFPSCTILASNGTNPFVPDKRFWKREFNRISDAYREKTDVRGETDSVQTAT